MLYKNDLILNHIFAAIVSKLGCVYYKFSFKRRKYETFQPGDWQKKFYIFVRLCAIFRVLQCVYAMYNFFLQPSSKLYHKMMVYTFPVGVAIVLFLDLYLTRIDHEYCYTLNTFHNHPDVPEGRRTMSEWRQEKTETLALIFSPFTVGLVPVVVLSAYLFDPMIPLATWRDVPDQFRSIYTLLGSMVWDVISLGVLAIILWNFLLIGLAFVNIMDHELKVLLHDAVAVMEQKAAVLARIRMMNKLTLDIRRLCVSLTTFNRTGALLVFIVKQFATFASIFGIYMSIHYLGKEPWIGIGAGFIGFPIGLLYNLVFDETYKFPHKMNRIRETYLVATRSHILKKRAEYYKRVSKSILFKGVQVGSFQVLEREATLNFANFVTSQVVSLLVASDSISS